MVLIYAGLKLAPASHGGILTPGLQPFLVTILAIFFLNTWPDRARVLALIPIALGVVAVAAPSVMNIGLDTNLLMGDLLLITASTVWAFYSVLAKRWPYDPWILTRFLCLASALVYLPPYLLFAPKGIMDASWTMLIVQGLYQGLAPTILAMMFFLKAVKELGAERTGALISLVPILAGLGAVPLLDEPLTPWLIAGLILVSGGAFLAARPKSHAKPKDAP
jgi:drug/metabolite transporter (DMT)-like permease